MIERTKKYFRVLTIAGSDSGGGAGIQADLKTIAASGCYGMSVITALTAQNTCGVSAIHPVPPDFIIAQLDAVLSDIGCDAVKIGMLYSAEVIQVIAERLQHYKSPNIVLDPVMVAQSGDRLIQEEAVAALREILFPLAEVVTPNLPEAEILVGYPVKSENEIEKAALDLLKLGPQNVLIKGGHGDGEQSDDYLYLGRYQKRVVLPGMRLTTENNHGTGCTLSSAIAAHLAKGLPIEEAARQAKEYIGGAIGAGAMYRIGKGHGPVHHFHRFW
jgi:hydroxymethylpyrimidine/phosphomethylpyrimidine kinase